MIKRCINGHFYDGDKFPICPHCGAPDENSEGAQSVSASPAALNPAPQDKQNVVFNNPALPNLNTDDDDDDATIPLAFLQRKQQSAGLSDEPQNNEPVVSSSTVPSEPISTENDSPAKENTDTEDNTELTEQPQTTPEASPEIPFVSQPAAPAQPKTYNSLLPPLPTEEPETVQPTPKPSYQPQQAYAPAPQPSYQPQQAYAPAPQPSYQPQQAYASAPQPSYQSQQAYAPVDNAEKNSPEKSFTVGWLVALSGGCCGESFELKSGRNNIGSSPETDITLTGDDTIAPRHAAVTFDVKDNAFFAAPYDAGKALTVNNEAVTANYRLKAYDKLTLGNTKLLFFPLCTDNFSWDKK